jgi:hypothetical protein
MPHKSASDAIRARLAANWTKSAILGVNADMEPPTDGSPWVRVTFPVANDDKLALGPRYRDGSSAFIAVATEIAIGLEKSSEWCSEIAAIFRNHKFDGVDCAFAAPTINEGRDQGSYWIASVVVPYRYFYSD